MSKFRVGQLARCITPKNPRITNEEGGGSGWEQGMEFKIVRISNETDVPIYWPELLGGIYEDWIENAEEWDGENNTNIRR